MTTTQAALVRWLDQNNPDEHCGSLRLSAQELRPIVAARCKQRIRKEVPLKSGRECDPCFCGWQGGWHQECYWHFNQDNPPRTIATKKNALQWRKKIALEA